MPELTEEMWDEIERMHDPGVPKDDERGKTHETE